MPVPQRSRRPRPLLFLLCAVFCAAIVGGLRAEDVKFPADGTGVVLTLPEGWSSTADTEGDLVVAAPDGKFTFQVIGGKPMDNPAADLADLGKNVVAKAQLTDVKTETSKEITKPGGLKMLTHGVQGKREGKEFTGLLVLFTTGDSQCLFLIFDTAEAVNAQDKGLAAITNSVRVAPK